MPKLHGRDPNRAWKPIGGSGDVSRAEFEEVKKTIADLGDKVQTYITEDIGELYRAVSDYAAWCPCTLHFDKSLSKFVSLIYGAPQHVNTESELYVSYIDKDSFVATEPVLCSYVDSDGNDISIAKKGTTSWILLSDGTYLMIHGASDGNTHRFVSDDNGVTWKSTGIATGGFENPWYITELSSGRLIASDDASKAGFAYSDDKGYTWTKVVPASCGGDYEAEACILEVNLGRLVAIGRYSVSGKGAYDSGDSEHAIISTSEDCGTTWTSWELSDTIDNMNASSCTGIVHDGVVEVFVTSRWYSIGGNVNTDNTNTGKSGALIHYTATAENALKDNFTRKGIIDYAKATGEEFHSPCVAVDDKNRILICHMDGGEKSTCNHRYLRGAFDNLAYWAKDGSASPVKSYSAKYLDSLIATLNDKILYLQNIIANMDGSGAEKPSGTWVDVLRWSAAEAYASNTFLESEGSDFYGLALKQDTYSSFNTDSAGNYYQRMYSKSVKNAPSESALDFKLSIDMNGESNNSYKYYVYYKDGYVTALSERSDRQLYDDNNGAAIVAVISEGGVIEIYDGGCTVDGTDYELTRVIPAEFVANIQAINNGAYVTNYAKAVDGNGVDGATTIDPANDFTTNFVGAYLSGYNAVEAVVYKEIY